MPRSSKTKRVPVSERSFDDNFSTTSAATTSTLPPHLRGVSVSSPPTVPPHLRGALSRSVAPVGTPPSPKASTSREQATAKPANSVNPARSYPCPYAGCLLEFPSEAYLIKHKLSPEAGHDYCKVCNLDFEDDDAFHLHKLNSDKHITCKICSEDFKSEAGCKRHENQMHAMQQNIKCRGCGKVFLKGAALLNHVEKSQCPGISVSDFETGRALVALGMHIASNTPDNDYDLPLASSTVGDSVGGGVPLEDYSLMDEGEVPESLPSVMPSLGRMSSTSSKSTSKAGPTHNVLYECNYPALKKQPKGKEIPKYQKSITGDTDDMSERETWASHNFPGALPTPAPAGWQPARSDASFVSTVDPINGHRTHKQQIIVPRDIVTGKFYCPWSDCSAAPFATEELVQAHIHSGSHRGHENRCFGCLRKFKTPSALTAHMESSSERCHVRESREFAKQLNLVSGGYLGVNGRHVDGSVKIDTPDIPEGHW